MIKNISFQNIKEEIKNTRLYKYVYNINML